ncbi:MAG: leucine-rich repeat domain-containing protein [Bacteroidaceae bacterium]|nr:leucine-rich repeat domain-containing protein [Bacteroidaceae bacterium]
MAIRGIIANVQKFNPKIRRTLYIVNYKYVKLYIPIFNRTAVLLLIYINIPNNVTSIVDYAFSWCYRLTPITIPNSVTRIGSHTFACCDALTSINIPNCVTSIGNYAFCQ